MTAYHLTKRNGESLVTILPHENDGPGSENSPIQVTHVNASSLPYFVVVGDYSTRFHSGFAFRAGGGTPYDGEYVTAQCEYHSEHNTTWIYVDALKQPLETMRRGEAHIRGIPTPKLPVLTYHAPNESTPLLLVGYGNTEYNHDTTWGEVLQQNLIHITENFSCPSPPHNPLIGQQWYNPSSQTLSWWDGDDWRAVATKEFVTNSLHKALDRPLNAIPPIPTSPDHVTSKRYVDGYVNGVMWKTPILDPNVLADNLTAPPVAPMAYDATYLVSKGEGEWAGLDGHLVTYDGAEWVSVLGRPIQTEDRFGIQLEPSDSVLTTTNPTGSFTNRAGQIATVVATNPPAFTFEIPAEPDAVAVVSPRLPGSYFSGRGYTFKGTYGKGPYGAGFRWIEFVFNPPKRPPAHPPSSSYSPGEIGDIVADNQYIYVKGKDSWVRIKAELF